jgi:SAM-dependent methyltransferase
MQRPSIARVYDYYLGGSHNFAVDRELGARIVEVAPETVQIARANRAFLRRAVRYCVEVGIRQFLDLGSGIPTVGNVHDVAQSLDAAAKVVYVDVDPVAVAHGMAILAGNDRATVIRADLRDVDGLLARDELTSLIDFAEPVAVLMVSVLHFVPDEDRPERIIAAYAEATAPGSHLVISHASTAGFRQEKFDTAREQYARTSNQLVIRSREQVAGLMASWELVEPGLTYLSHWRPESAEDVEPDAENSVFLAGVGRRGRR